MNKNYLFTSESVSSGHPDKLSDQISDSILDEFLKNDPNSKVACETFCTTGLVLVGGEVKSETHVDVNEIVRKVIKDVGYDKSDYGFDYKSCGVISTIHEQSQDINRGVDKKEQGAGDQGIMFGYASNETDNFLPLTLALSHELVYQLELIRKKGDNMKYLRPDSKSQVSIEFDKNDKPIKIDTILISTQHDDFLDDDEKMIKIIKEDMNNYLIPTIMKKFDSYLFDDFKLLVNPTGKFVIGGPHGDTGLTGRKIIVDTYGGYGNHGGGAFSGKDPSKVDRSAAYMARYIAKNMVSAGVADKLLIQLSYAIGVDQPVSIYVNSYGTSKIDENILSEYIENFDFRPKTIISQLKLKNPIYYKTSCYGHFGREPFVENGIEYFTWEKLDLVEVIKRDLFS